MAVVLTAVAAALAPTASASITPTMTLDQSAGNAAGSVANLGLDLKFAPTSGDSPDAMTLNLPPGLLANASINGGACLTHTDLSDNKCEVGSGMVTATLNGIVPAQMRVTFDLVPPPAAGDLAGLAVNSAGTQIGSTADIKVRASGDPLGVGVTITFVLPNSLFGAPISITDINSTFAGLRYPTTCPATPQNLSVSVNSYSDPTVRNAAAPLTVTRCSALAFAPKFTLTAVQDTADPQVVVTTEVTQAATEAPGRSVTLNIPPSVLMPNVGAVLVLCPTFVPGKCTSVGSVTATSPDYPKALTGQAFLVGDLSNTQLVLTFPSPFQLTLVGHVDLQTNATTFTGLPDIPLTDLKVTLFGGSNGLFTTKCAPSSGTASADLTDQNGDKTAHAPNNFTIAPCKAAGGGSGGGNGGGSGNGSAAGAKLTKASFAGLASGHPSLRFTVAAKKGARALRRLTVELPHGLHFVRRHGTIPGVSLTGATIKSLSLSHGHLVILLRKPARSVTVRIGAGALAESASLRSRAKAKSLGRLLLTVIADSSGGTHTTIRARIR